MWELDYKESWVSKNWCFGIVVWEKTLESPLDCKEIQPVHPKINQSWIITGRTNSEAESSILWLSDAKSQLIRKDPDARKDWRQEEKGATEDEMVVWHHWLNALEFEHAPGDSEGQGSLVCCSPWGLEVSDMTERLHFHFSFSCIEEGNGHPLQCSCLENPRDRGAWWAAVYGVAKGWAQLSN